MSKERILGHGKDITRIYAKMKEEKHDLNRVLFFRVPGKQALPL